MPDTKMGSIQEQRVHPQEQDMEVGYEDSPTPQTLERLEQKFHNDIMKLFKEMDDAEDAENTRHKEKIAEINSQYQERLSALRARHASRREEFLQRESQTRLQTYQHAGMSPYRNNSGPSDMNQGHHGFGAPDMIHGGPRQEFGGPGGGVPFDSYRQRRESFGRGRMQGGDIRVPTPGGRVYNTGPHYY
ncbi:Ninein [Bienertia sinuspersici]